jgi:uncharacterized membrane protein YoaK (UPF0700 family)
MINKKARGWIISIICILAFMLFFIGVVVGTSSNEVLESSDSGSSSSSSKTTIIKEKEIITFVSQDETKEDSEEIINLNKPIITGATIGTLLTSGNLMFIIAMICVTFIVFLVITSRTIIKASNNK